MLKNLVKHAIQLGSQGHFVFHYNVPGKVFLTFDDGPDERNTPLVLETLSRYRCQATFFLIGSHVDKFPDLAAEVSARGHRLGLHTFTHRHLDEMKREIFFDEIRRNQQAIRNATGTVPAILRPPRGRIKLQNLLWAVQSNLQIVHFTTTSNDWKAKSVQEVVDQVDLTRIRGGEIISFHDNNCHTVGALPVLLDGLANKGFICEAIPDANATSTNGATIA